MCLFFVGVEAIDVAVYGVVAAVRLIVVGGVLGGVVMIVVGCCWLLLVVLGCVVGC